jgi:serine/threonine-protein kinase RsbT
VTQVEATPTPHTQELIPIRGEDDIVLARQRARDTARQIGFGMVDQSRIATAVSELARNVVRYANGGEGECTITSFASSTENDAGIEIVVRDSGPGIADLDQAMREGYTSSGGLGMGLPGTKRLMDEMDIQTEIGVGTVITIRKWRRV